jgi:C1A family cysteine protease
MKKYGLIKDFNDKRDYQYKLTKNKSAIPPAASNRSTCSPIEDQKNIGSCGPESLVGSCEHLELKLGKPLVDLSVLFAYYNARLLMGTVNYDSGVSNRYLLKAAAKYGVCKEAYWPYRAEKFKIKPTKTAYADGLNRQILRYERISSMDQFKDAIASGYLVIAGISVYESFESDKVARTGMVPTPVSGEKFLGGHDIDLVGYDDNKRLVEFRNSWGDWGDQGYGYLSYDFVNDPDLCSDAWVVYSMEM